MNRTTGTTLIVCGAGYVSGKEIITLELGSGLAQFGHTVSFITSSWTNGDFASRLEQRRIPADTLALGFISATLSRTCLRMTAEQLLSWPGLLVKYSRIVRELNPLRVIHTNWHHALLLLLCLKPERDVFWLHELIPDTPRYRRVFGFLQRRLDCFVCVSHASADSLRRIGINNRKIKVIHNGLADPASDATFRSNTHDTFRIGIIGQVGVWKGHSDLLEACGLVVKKHPQIELNIYGRGDPQYERELLQEAVRHCVADKVVWHGFVTDRNQIYRHLDLCVVPSRSHDPFPTTALEAGFFGLPTIATRRGGLPEIINHEVNGLLVGAESPSELADAMSRLIEDHILRETLAIGARRIAVERFENSRFIKQFHSSLVVPDQLGQQ